MGLAALRSMPAGICKLGLLLALLWIGYSGMMVGKEKIMRRKMNFWSKRTLQKRKEKHDFRDSVKLL